MAVEYEISSDVAVIKETGSVSQCARVTQMYSGQITYDDEAGSKFATATINGKSQRVMLCIAVNGTVTYDDVPSLYSTVDGHRCLNIVTPTETGTPDDVPSLYETVVIDGQNVRAVRCIMINKTPVYDGVSSVCTFTGDDGKTHTAQLVNKITGGSVQVIIKGTSPLNLPDAIANSLSCVKAFGGTEQRDIPDNYLQRQYIYMMDKSYLLTDIVPTYDGHYEIDFQTTSTASQAVTYLGARTGGSGNKGLRFAHVTNKTFIVYGFGSTANSTEVVADNTRYKFVWNNQRAILTSGDTTVFDNTFTTTGTTADYLAINGWNYDGAVSGNLEGIYLYSFKAWNAQGELVADYVPAVEKAAVPVVGFYDTVSKTFKTPTAGTFAAGPEAVPTPDAPMDIVSNNGVLKASPNILQGEWFLNQSRTSAGGALYSLNGAVASDIFPVQSNTTYTVCYDGVANDARWYEYDANKSYITGSFVAASKTITTSSNTKYISVSFMSGQLPDAVTQEKYKLCSVNKGNVALPFIPYGTIYTDGTVETINAHGKNLFNGAFNDGWGISSTNGEITSSAGRKSFYIPVKAGQKYTISRSAVGESSYWYYGTYNNEPYTAGQACVSFNNMGASATRYTITIPNGANYLAIFFGTGTSPNVQAEQGSTATEYTPYFNGGTATAEMLLKLGDYQDVQSILDGVVTRNVGVIVFDGTESWTRGTSTDVSDNRVFYLELADRATGATMQMLCSHYVYTLPASYVTLTTGKFLPNATNSSVYFDGGSITTKADWKQWLSDQHAAGTPVIVIYPLATPTTESVTGQTLQVTNGDNVLEITQASLNGLELEAKYQAAVSLTIQEVQDANLDPNVEVTIN